MTFFKKLIFCFFFSFLLISNSFCQYNEIIQELSEKISSLQVKNDTKFNFPFEYQKPKGIYETWIHLNFHGNLFSQLLRNNFKVFDENGFVTAWINEILLESNKIGTIQLDKDQLLNSIKLETKFVDKTVDDPIIVYWIQEMKDDHYVTQHPNLVGTVEKLKQWSGETYHLLNSLGLKGLAEKIGRLHKKLQKEELHLQIPADADDTSVNLAMGCLLYENKDKFPDSFDTWWDANKNISGIMKYFLKYAYYPLSDDKNLNSIDPRSYYFMHEFLESGIVKEKDFGIVTTWFLNRNEYKENYPYRMMRYNINSVDASVCSNFIYGLSQLSVSKLIPLTEWMSDEIKKLYLDTSIFVDWTIKSGRLVERPDLGSLYYPPIYAMYWFTSRTLSLFSGNSFPDPVFETVYSMLLKTMQNEATKHILESAQEDDNYVWWDDFLGVNDTYFNGKYVNNAEDRIFTTSMAINTLIDTWTIRKNYKYSWRKETPDHIKKIIEKGINWLVKYSLSSKFKPENSFFSITVKSEESFPFYFPATFIEFVNGTTVSPNSSPSIISFELTPAMEGIVSKEEYNHMVYDEMHFQSRTPTHFSGFNLRPFFSWSSPAFTYSSTLFAISKYSSLIEKENK
ncbi:hypothetical protein M0811_08370 [Anaeramoeba ignava]|uniref:Uncharacterized protein n=1 Tax=Anaeramoeba ignava TaxID=1746090 RepID=A0A9Q0LI62_ANAIG|nr:hypothetical protein M0811_08370 [Anaeramoeba ignava]